MNANMNSRHWPMAIMLLLATGIFAGCDYCAPALLAMIAIRLIYRVALFTHDAIQVTPVIHH